MAGQTLKDDFDTLDIEYKANINDSDVITALNNLNDIDRSLFIQYIECGCKYSKMIEKSKITYPVIRRRIRKIRENLKYGIKNLQRS